MWYIFCSHHTYNVLIYCYEVWGNTYENKIPSLYVFQKKTITICKYEGYLSNARPIIHYFKTMYVYDMIDLNSMMFMFKLTTASRSYILSYFERVCDSYNHNACNINSNYKIYYSIISIMGLEVWNQIESGL